MATQTLLKADEEPGQQKQAGRAGISPEGLALISAVLLWTSFPPAGWGWLAWIALVPFFVLVRSQRPRWRVYLAAWLGGETFWLLAIRWVRLTDQSAWLGWVVMATVLSLWWPAALLLARLAVRRMKLPLMFGAPTAWVALEFVRAYAFTGFPWYYLAHSQYQYLPVIQIADLTGALGLSFLMAMANACGADLLTLPLVHRTHRGLRVLDAQGIRLAIVVASVLITLAYGLNCIKTADFRPGPRVALIQSNIEQVYRGKLTSDQILAIYERLIARVLRAPERPDLIVWPETSYPYGFVALDPQLARDEFLEQIRSFHPEGTVDYWNDKLRLVTAHLHGWVDRMKIPMVVGTITNDFRHGGLSKFNSAILFEPGKTTIQSYHKLHLVPFGEYVPLVQTFPWLVYLTPYRGERRVPGLTFGAEPSWIDFRGLRVATAICFEDTVPQVVRRFFVEVPDRHPPDLLLNLSNDGWFWGSEELDMHLAISVFRCVEHRVPLVRAVNTGISAIVDGNGRILASLGKLKEDILIGVVPLDDRVSLYTAWGDWVGQGCLTLCVALILLAVGQSLRGRRRSAA
jgi:apolipoprotein N-acyltransferase